MNTLQTLGWGGSQKPMLASVSIKKFRKMVTITLCTRQQKRH